MQKIIASVVLAVTAAFSVVLVPAAAVASGDYICQQGDDAVWRPVQTGENGELSSGNPTHPFPQNALGCDSLPQPSTRCDVVETSSVQTVVDTRRVERLRAKVAELRRKLRALR